ncbi:neurogenic locus notch homolog protein 1 isoform X2 [Magallana gigas]|uniref:neurogenic locus notch homolog protein 1 isoform X2 n=1 Tax=Magallana gigas TaxID=29159 RepID=UPI00334019FD
MRARHLLCVLLFGVSIATVQPRSTPKIEDVRLRDLLNALDKYVTNQKDLQSRGSNGAEDPLEKDILSTEDENDAERQTVIVGDKELKPNNVHVNEQQANDDDKDRHPRPPVNPPVVGVKKAIQARNFGISSSFLWENGVIPYEIDANSFGTRLGQATTLIENMVAHIAQTTCVRWRLKTADDAYFVKITGDQNGCWSYVGNVKFSGGQGLNLGQGCLDEYVVLHELHHAMGGLHEQQRNRRKYFVKINWENIQSAYNDQYALSAQTKNNEVYDYASILQYHLTAFTSNGKNTMTIPDQDLEYLISNFKSGFSFYDMAEVNQVYSCPSASCTVSCQNEGFRMQAVDKTTCECQCPSGLKGTTCEELDTDADCGKIINLSNGGSEEIKMTSYTQGKTCTWLVKGESDSIIKATVTSVDLPFSSQNDCYHWLEFRDYLIGDEGKELCGQSTTTKTYTQANIGKASPFMIRFNSQKTQTPGTGFTVKVEAMKSGCISSPCKTGSLCTEGSGDGSYTCSCQNGLSGKNCDEFRAPSYNLCDHEDDFGTCLFDRDPSSDIGWNFNTRLCDWRGCGSGVLTRGTGYQFLTLTPYYDGVPWNYGSKAAIKTSAQLTAVDRCLSFDYSLGNYEQGSFLTEINVYVEGTGKTKTNVKNLKTTTDYTWKTETVSISAVDNLVIYIEGKIGPQLIGVDNISLRPGLCTNTPCNPNPCLNSGTCDESSPPTGSKYVCTCPTGFSGDRCETSVTTNPCDSNTCQNGATCVADATKTDGYRCDCATGFTGDKCETPVPTNPCDSNTCQNGATCVADATKTDGYRCDCATGFTGDKCETTVPTNACDGNTCQNGATCVADATKTDGYRCDCATGFTGDKCDVSTNPCDSNTCQNGATCVADATKTDGYRCDCATGFTGDKCDMPTNPCDSNTCQNGATCVADATKTDGYRCDCATGFTGDKCDMPTNPCDSNTCQNGATCVADATKTDRYRCDCATGFTGDKCDVTVNPCDNNDCQNFASCVADATDSKGYRCLCTSGFTGEKCEIQDYCYDFPCKNGGTCTSGTATYFCQCTSDYTGPTCDTSVTIDYCNPSPCLNGASCTSYDFGYYCDCPSGFSGDKCEIPVTNNFCDSSPCNNGGTCHTDDFGSYCICPMDFSGDLCEIAITDHCSSYPCVNGGTCMSYDTDFYCACPEGYTGQTCEIPFNDACLSDPCQNGGSCINTPGDVNPYLCDCQQGFLGQNCEGFSCDFERWREPSCFMRTKRVRGWSRRNRRTPSWGTGPSSAYSGRYFFYFEASGQRRNKQFNVFSNIPFQNGTHCLSLQYHMWGSNNSMGSFLVLTYSPGLGFTQEFRVTGNQGNQWNFLELDLNLDESTKVVIRAIRGRSYKSDIAIDDVTLMPYPCNGTTTSTTTMPLPA